jgi:HK97 family phage prohead protease
MTDYTDASWSADDLEFKAVTGQLNVDEAQGIVECFVAAVGNKDSVGDIVARGAFDGSLRRRKPRVVWGHDWNQPIGKVLAIEEVPSSDSRLPEKMQAASVGGLLARVQFNLKSERGREAFYSVAFFGTDQEWSIGYKTIKATYDPAAQANVLQEVELFEVSPVLHGANQLTGTISIKSMHGDMEMDESEDSDDPKGYDSEWSDWSDKDDDSYEMPERDESPANSSIGRRRVRMVMRENGIGEIHSGSNRHQVSLDELNNDGSSINGDDRPGLGNAVSKAVNSSIQLRITQPNFVIFDMASEDGDVDTFFMPYHYDAQGGQYMFGDSMEVEVEMNVKFGMGSDEEYESEGKSAYDPALSADDFEDLEEKGILGRIGRGVGRGDNPLRGRNPKDVVDRNNDGWLFSGPNRIRAVDRTGPDAGGQAGIEEDLNIGMERLKRIALADRKKPAKKPGSLTSNRLGTRGPAGKITEAEAMARLPERQRLLDEALARAKKRRELGLAPKLTSNRMDKPGKPSTQMTYAERAAQRREIDKAKIEASDAKLRKLEADRKVRKDRASLLQDQRDLAKVNEAEGYKGNGYKGQTSTELSDPQSLIIKPSESGSSRGDTLDPDILNQVKEGDVVKFGEPGKDGMSSGVVRQILVNMDDNEDMDPEDKLDLDSSPNFEIYVTHFDGVPIAESQRYTVRAGGASEPDSGSNDVEMDLGELVNGLRVFKGQ